MDLQEGMESLRIEHARDTNGDLSPGGKNRRKA